jgi:hypothetical protein
MASSSKYINQNEKYSGYEELTSYLKQTINKSFWGFLCCCRDAIVDATLNTPCQDPAMFWCDHFLAEAKELLSPNEYNILEEKVCFFYFAKLGQLLVDRWFAQENYRV